MKHLYDHDVLENNTTVAISKPSFDKAIQLQHSAPDEVKVKKTRQPKSRHTALPLIRPEMSKMKHITVQEIPQTKHLATPNNKAVMD